MGGCKWPPDMCRYCVVSDLSVPARDLLFGVDSGPGGCAVVDCGPQNMGAETFLARSLSCCASAVVAAFGLNNVELRLEAGSVVPGARVKMIQCRCCSEPGMHRTERACRSALQEPDGC